MVSERRAVLFRKPLPENVRRFGVRAKAQLEAVGFAIEDRTLLPRDEAEAFPQQAASTTPQVFVGSKRVGVGDDIERYLAAA